MSSCWPDQFVTANFNSNYSSSSSENGDYNIADYFNATHPLIAVVKTAPPFANDCIWKHYCQCSKSEWGLNLEFFHYLMGMLGIPYVFIPADNDTTGWEQPRGVWHGMLGQLQRHEAHMSGSLIHYTWDRKQSFQFTLPVTDFKYGFLIKSPDNHESSPLNASPTYLISPFDSTVWLAVIGSILVVTLMNCFYSYRVTRSSDHNLVGHLEDSLYLVGRSVIGQVEFEDWERFSLRNKLTPGMRYINATWLCFLTVLTALYTTGLYSNMILSAAPTKLPTALELIQLINASKLTVVTTDIAAMQPAPLDKFKNKSEAEINPIELIALAYNWNKPKLFESQSALIKAIASASDANYVYYESSFEVELLKWNRCDLRVIVDTNSEQLAYAVRSDLPWLADLINRAMYVEISADDYVQHLYRKYGKTSIDVCRGQKVTYEKLTMKKHLYGLFTVYLVIAALAVLAFVIELVLRNRQLSIAILHLRLLHRDRQNYLKNNDNQ